MKKFALIFFCLCLLSIAAVGQSKIRAIKSGTTEMLDSLTKKTVWEVKNDLAPEQQSRLQNLQNLVGAADWYVIISAGNNMTIVKTGGVCYSLYLLSAAAIPHSDFYQVAVSALQGLGAAGTVAVDGDKKFIKSLTKPWRLIKNKNGAAKFKIN
jgi:hypothetical protein